MGTGSNLVSDGVDLEGGILGLQPSTIEADPPQTAHDVPRCLVVMYHYVREENPLTIPRRSPADRGIHALTVEAFAAQVDQLCKVMEPIDWPSLFGWMNGGRAIPERSFLLTFDDGLADHAEFVVPLLDRRGIRGLFFVPGVVLHAHHLISAHAIHLLLDRMDDATLERKILEAVRQRDDSNIDWPSKLDDADATTMYHYEPPTRARLKYLLNVVLPIDLRRSAVEAVFEAEVGSPARWAKRWYLGWDDLSAMQSAGHTIGAHGFTHEPYTRMTRPQRIEDLRRVRAILNDGLGPDRRPVSYPFGCHDEDTITEARDAGFAQGFTTERQMVTHGCAQMSLPRVDTIDVNATLQEV